MWLGELRSTNPLRIPHPKIDKLACQAQGVGILAKGEITLHDAYCEHFYYVFRFAKSSSQSVSIDTIIFYHIPPLLSSPFRKKIGTGKGLDTVVNLRLLPLIFS